MEDGLFITFEGTEGSGKSTQIQLLARRLNSLGRETLVLREPGGTPIGEEVREILKHSPSSHGMVPETELLLMNACRAQLIRERIRPALAKGQIVLCDRFSDSTIAYQGYGRQLDLRWIEKIIEFTMEKTYPNLTILLRVPLNVSEDRRASRNEIQPKRPDRLEESGREFFKRVQQGYDELAIACGDRIRTIDATQSIEQVEKEIWLWAGPFFSHLTAQGDAAFKSVGEYPRHAPI